MSAIANTDFSGLICKFQRRSFKIDYIPNAPILRLKYFAPTFQIKNRHRAESSDTGLNIRATLFDLPGVNEVTILSFYLPSSIKTVRNRTESFMPMFTKPWIPGGIVVRDRVMSADRTQPLDGALFAVNMLVGRTGGGTSTFDEIAEGLNAAGFSRIRQLQSKGMFLLVEGFKEN